MSQDRLVFDSSSAAFTQELADRLDALQDGDSLLLVFADAGSVGVASPEREFTLELDINYNLSFALDITTMLDSVDWHLGMYDQSEHMAPPAQCRMALHDPQGAFSLDRAKTTPNQLGNKLLGMMVRLQVTVERATHTLLQGWIVNASPHERSYGRVTELTLSDKMQELYNHDYQPMLQQFVSISDELKKVFANLPVCYPYSRSFWVLGVSTLGTNTKVLEPGAEISDSSRVLEWVGDAADRGNGVSAYGYIRDLLATEIRGRFFTNRVGKFVFHDANRDTVQTVADTFTDADYDDFRANQSTVYNSVTVEYYPRELGNPGTALHVADNVPFSLEPGEKRQFTAPYFDPENRDARVGGIDVIYPQRNVDYFVTQRGRRNDGAITVSAELGASEARVALRNNSNRVVVVHRFQIRGTPIISYAPEEITDQDPASIFHYGIKDFGKVQLRFADNEGYAQSFAREVLNRHSDQRMQYEWVVFNIGGEGSARDALASRVLVRTIGDVIRLQNGMTGHDELYVIVGEEHRIQGKAHIVAWVLRRVLERVIWTLGTSQLGMDTGTVLGL